MHQYRVTKYNPAFRNSAGHYLKNEWTSFSDVGRSFGGHTLHQDEYLKVESAYVEVVESFLGEDHASGLRVVGLEAEIDTPHVPAEGTLIGKKDIASLCRSVLREQFWCKLEAEGRFIHFGYDYYVYIGVIGKCDGSIAKTRALGLFIEEFESPYLATNEDSSGF